MNGNEIARLAAAVNILRPDWPTASLQTFIDQHLAKRSYRDAAVALTYVACDPDTRTPKRVLEHGAWWEIGESERPTPIPPPFETPRNVPAHHRSEGAARARAALHQALGRTREGE